MNIMTDNDNLNKPKASIIVSAYNSSLTIEKCLESVLNQDYPELELIVIDDFSTDDTLKKISKFKVKVFTNAANYGAAYSRNMGAKNANSEILIFVDSDIVVPKDSVSRIIKTFQEKPRILAIGGIYSENTQDLNFISDYKNMDLAYRGILNPRYVKYLGGFFLAIKKEAFLNAGGFSCDFSGSSVEDVEFGYRVSEGKNILISDSNIRVDHLKRYTFFNMLKVDFMRIINLMKIRKISKGKYKAGEHIPAVYILNIFLPGIIILSFIMGIQFNLVWLNILLIILFLLNNLGFFRFLLNKRGVNFAIKSLFVLFIEYIVVEISILISLFISVPKFSKQTEQILQ